MGEIRPLTQNAVAGAGTNILYVDVPPGSKVHVINAQNATTGNLAQKWDLMSRYSNPGDAITGNITLFNGLQSGTYVVVLTYGSPLPCVSFTRFVVTFLGCTAADQLTLTVGYEI